ncbi:reverse transcriptase domain-containing protein [Tanacetum coccineum]
MMASFFQMHAASSLGLGSLPRNTIPNPQADLKAITTQSSATLAGPSVPSPPLLSSKEMNREPETIRDQVLTGSTKSVPPLVVQSSPAISSELPPAPISSPVIPKPNSYQPPIPYLSSFAEALAHMPKFAKMVKDLLSSKEKLLEMENAPLNENCSALVECLALADLGASINIMPLFIWKMLSLLELTPTGMTLKLANRTFAHSKGITEDVIVKVGKFRFPADFIVADYDVDPRVPFILGRPFLRTARALINHANESINMINFIDITCEDSFEDVLKLKKSNHPSSGSTTPLFDSRPSLTSFETRDSLLEEFANELAFLDPFPPGNDDVDFEADL